MKLFPNQIIGIQRILSKVFLENYTADRAVQSILQSNHQWGSRDRKQIAKAAYDIIRNKLLLEHIAQSTDFESIIHQYCLESFDIQNAKLILSKENFQKAYSISDELYQYGLNALSENVWKREVEAMDSEAFVFLRPNLAKTSIEQLSNELNKNDFKNSIIHIQINQTKIAAIKLDERKNFSALPLYINGYFEVQDLGSQLISKFLNPKPNRFVIDACAGAGGKTLHLSNLLNNTGRIVALDSIPRKLEELEKRATRNGATNILVKEATTENILKLKDKADYLLLDVPCSGSGTIKRQADLKYRINAALINEKRTIQKTILQDYSKMLKVEGELIYATCSLFPDENEKIINEFLNTHTNFDYIDSIKIWPSEHPTDGFFMTKLKRVS